MASSLNNPESMHSPHTCRLLLGPHYGGNGLVFNTIQCLCWGAKHALDASGSFTWPNLGEHEMFANFANNIIAHASS